MTDLTIFQEYVDGVEDADEVTGLTDSERAAIWRANRRTVARLEAEADAQGKRDIATAAVVLLILLIVFVFVVVNLTSIRELVR